MAVDVHIENYEGTFQFMSPSFLSLYKQFFIKIQNVTYNGFIDTLKRCECCTVRPEARQPVPPEGDQSSDIVLVGRNPGIQEDINGRPFFPAAPGGKWLGKYLEALDLKRQDVYITNSLFCYTKKDRPPEWHEISVCAAWKVVEFSFLRNMRYLFLLGNDAIREFYGHDTKSVVRIFGVIYRMKFQGRPLIVFPCYHPAFTMRKDILVKDTFSYLKAAREIIELDRSGKMNWEDF